jgi:hypothetical protein
VRYRTLAYCACIEAGTPLSLMQMAQGIVDYGYALGDGGIEDRLAGVLTGDRRFSLTPDGLWTAATHGSAQPPTSRTDPRQMPEGDLGDGHLAATSLPTTWATPPPS